MRASINRHCACDFDFAVLPVLWILEAANRQCRQRLRCSDISTFPQNRKSACCSSDVMCMIIHSAVIHRTIADHQTGEIAVIHDCSTLLYLRCFEE